MGLESLHSLNNLSLDIIGYQSRFGPVVKTLSINIVQTLKNNGIVWVPIDIIMGGICSDAHRGHFTAIQLIKQENMLHSIF